MQTIATLHPALHRLLHQSLAIPAANPSSARAILRIENSLGLHARPAALFVRTANQFECDILVSNGEEVVEGKSILSILMLGAAQGSSIEIVAVGEDAEAAVFALSELVESRFGED